MNKNKPPKKNLEAASKFYRKRITGTRTRDIAEKTGNKFGTHTITISTHKKKKKITFEQVMKIKSGGYSFGKIFPFLSNEKTSFRRKIDLASENISRFLSKNPNLLL